MKKCNFLAVLITALFMVMGFEGFSQDYVPSTKAVYLVQNQVEVLGKSSASMTSNAKVSASANVLQSLKVAFGQAMLEPLKSGNDVTSAINIVAGTIRSNVPARQALINETISFYKNLLKK